MRDGNDRDLGGIELLASLSDAERLALERACRWQSFLRNQVIFDKEDSSTDVYLVVKGAVQIISYTSSGREVLFSTIRAGGFFGELSAIDGAPRSAHVKATEPTLLASISGDQFQRLLREKAEVTLQVLTRAVQLVRACDDRIMSLSTLSAVQRIYSRLMEMAKPDSAGAGYLIVRPLPPMREIAAMVGTSRETAARAISELRRSEIVSQKGRNLYILDRERLQKLIGSL